MSIEPDDMAPETDADGFTWVGGLLALDLVNTEVVVRGRRYDLLGTPADARRWLAGAQQRRALVPTSPDSGPAADQAEAWLAELQSLRLALRALLDTIVAGEQAEPATLARLNAALEVGAPQLAQRPDGRHGETFAIDGGPGAAALFAIAHSLLSYLASGDLSRLHHCGNPRCILYFVDTTKSATRRWCSGECMNRARSSQRYAAARARKQS
jgi:predicted RNA-binding Zn ribbon-like protein